MLASVLVSLRKLFGFLLLIIIMGISTVLVFAFLVKPINLPLFLHQVVDTTIVIGFGLVALFLLLRAKALLIPHTGLKAATVLQFLLIGLVILVLTFLTLGIFGVPVSTLLTSAGIISVTVGLIISTFVGGILSGTLVFTTYQLKVGEEIMVNNVPGKIIDMTPLVMRIRTDIGQITLPNSAIASGGVIISVLREPAINQENRLTYCIGDRVLTSFKNEEGTVKSVTALHTVVTLDSGRELSFLNSSILSGAVAIAKLTDASEKS